MAAVLLGLIVSAGVIRLDGSGPALADTSLQPGEPVPHRSG